MERQTGIEVTEKAIQTIEDERQKSLAQAELSRSVLGDLKNVIHRMRSAKPDERSELARRYAVSITDLEKVIAYFEVYVVGE